jgi:hypothetical protein
MSSRRTQSPIEVSIAEDLKDRLARFVTEGVLKEEFERHKKTFLDLSDDPGGSEDRFLMDWFVMDWFLFDWLDDRGLGAIAHYIQSATDLDDRSRRILIEWLDSINSVFELRSLKKQSLVLRELESGDKFVVNRAPTTDHGRYKAGQYLAARLLPFEDGFVFSHTAIPLPDRESADQALEVRRAIDSLSSPEAFERVVQEQCTAFHELFGCEEVTIKTSELAPTIHRFQTYMLTEWRDPESGKTPAETFKAEFGHEPPRLEPPSIETDDGAPSEVTLLCDEFEGVLVLPDYTRFKSVFTSSNPDADIPEWRDIVWSYITEPGISVMAFERVAETDPAAVERVLRNLLDDQEFSIEHLYALLLHYKEPREEFSELEDDERLWDLLDTGNPELPRETKPAAATRKKPASKTKQRAKTKSRKAATKSAKAKAQKTSHRGKTSK